MAKVLGIGGVFFKADDPEELARWYARHLGFEIDDSYGGTSFLPDGAPQGAYTIWSPFKRDTLYFAPSDNPYMINLVVDDLDGALEQVQIGGARLAGEPEDLPYGKFGWFIDPEGNKVELWQPSPDGAPS